MIGDNTKYIILAHLSEKNNTEQLALSATKEKLGNKKIQVLIAKQDEESPYVEV